jgi:hypothetical protein
MSAPMMYDGSDGAPESPAVVPPSIPVFELVLELDPECEVAALELPVPVELDPPEDEVRPLELDEEPDGDVELDPEAETCPELDVDPDPELDPAPDVLDVPVDEPTPEPLDDPEPMSDVDDPQATAIVAAIGNTMKRENCMLARLGPGVARRQVGLMAD